MIPITISDELLNRDFKDKDRKVTIGAPKGLEDTVKPVEAIVSETQLGKAVTLVIKCSEDDIKILQENEGLIYLCLYGNTIPVFSIDPVPVH